MTCDPVHLCGISLNFGHVIMTCDPTYNQSQKLKKKKKPGTPGHGTTENGKPAEQRNTPESQRNIPKQRNHTKR